jgi:hypothetical protein
MLAVTDSEYNSFVAMNPYRNAVIESDMVNSYIFIDSNGHLIDNSGHGHKTVSDLTVEDFARGFKRFNFNKTLYNSRYKKEIAV